MLDYSTSLKFSLKMKIELRNALVSALSDKDFAKNFSLHF
ncbi:hypothetical protein SMGD1_0071 [Sulfurimonas gotlandica GD1]|uniref:Uncharacterized protein n=1 Tax=Sulfurimonas gotlandica (strain DSM 19862 / JCM 16533 / GD1) TaxID=929558 RepID=H1FRP5_SULGG|nr:hypothetical protein SMGD1_0071 [Sulfurimonas gotlandica GD1]